VDYIRKNANRGSPWRLARPAQGIFVHAGFSTLADWKRFKRIDVCGGSLDEQCLWRWLLFDRDRSRDRRRRQGKTIGTAIIKLLPCPPLAKSELLLD
jgi:hypothetical protein